jgi:hypothetical protein
MTDRKPAGISWESWIDKQIRDGQERGEFDNLPGHGKPIADLDKPRDELWWLRDKLARENVAPPLPPQLEIRKDLEAAREQIRRATSESDVRTLIAEINDKIRYVNSHVISGPPSTVMPLDVERTVQRWRDAEA